MIGTRETRPDAAQPRSILASNVWSLPLVSHMSISISGADIEGLLGLGWPT